MRTILNNFDNEAVLILLWYLYNHQIQSHLVIVCCQQQGRLAMNECDVQVGNQVAQVTTLQDIFSCVESASAGSWS